MMLSAEKMPLSSFSTTHLPLASSAAVVWYWMICAVPASRAASERGPVGDGGERILSP